MGVTSRSLGSSSSLYWGRSTEEAGSVAEEEDEAAGLLESIKGREEGKDVEVAALVSLAGDEERAGRRGIAVS
jgi:hypothetical protein